MVVSSRYAYPRPYPSARKRVSGTDGANFCRAYGALSMGSPEDCGRLRLFRRGMPRLYVEILFAPIDTGTDGLNSVAPTALCAWAAPEDRGRLQHQAAL